MVILKDSIIQLVQYKFIELFLVFLQIAATTKTVGGNQIHSYNLQSLYWQADRSSSQSYMILASGKLEHLKNVIEWNLCVRTESVGVILECIQTLGLW